MVDTLQGFSRSETPLYLEATVYQVVISVFCPLKRILPIGHNIASCNTLRCIIDDDASFRVVMLYAQSIYRGELSQAPDLKFLGLFLQYCHNQQFLCYPRENVTSNQRQKRGKLLAFPSSSILMIRLF